MPTLKQVRALLAHEGITIRKRDNEYRVNYKNGKEATAYYTDDIDDAFHTGLAMAQELDYDSLGLTEMDRMQSDI